MIRRPPWPHPLLGALVMGLAWLAAAIGFMVWLVEVPLYLLRRGTLDGFKDADDWQEHFGFMATRPDDMRDQYARVLTLVMPWPDPADPKFDDGGLFHNLKGAWCVWVGLSRERSGKLLAFVIMLAIAGWIF